MITVLTLSYVYIIYADVCNTFCEVLACICKIKCIKSSCKEVAKKCCNCHFRLFLAYLYLYSLRVCAFDCFDDTTGVNSLINSSTFSFDGLGGRYIFPITIDCSKPPPLGVFTCPSQFV